MSRGVALLLGEVLEAIHLVEQYTAGLSFAAFSASIEKQDAVVRRLAVIGEAVKGVPDDFRTRYPDVAWRDIAGARDILIHEYFRIDLDLAWEMARNDLPALAVRIRAVMEAEGFDAQGAL
jgi:uncharacterized protein with HEPN domain